MVGQRCTALALSSVPRSASFCFATSLAAPLGACRTLGEPLWHRHGNPAPEPLGRLGILPRSDVDDRESGTIAIAFAAGMLRASRVVMTGGRASGIACRGQAAGQVLHDGGLAAIVVFDAPLRFVGPTKRSRERYLGRGAVIPDLRTRLATGL